MHTVDVHCFISRQQIVKKTLTRYVVLPSSFLCHPQVTCSDWTMIPAENLVSVATGTPTKIAVKVGFAFCPSFGTAGTHVSPRATRTRRFLTTSV